MFKIFRKIVSSFVALALVATFASASFAEIFADSLEFPMTIWGALVDSTGNVAAGATVSFIDFDSTNGNSKIGELTTSVAGRFGGDSAYDTNIALPKFTGELVIQVVTGGQTFTLDSDDLTAAVNNSANCPAKNALAFASETCRFDIDLTGASTKNLNLIPSGATIGSGSLTLSGDTTVTGSADLGAAGGGSTTTSGGDLTIHSSNEHENFTRISTGTNISVADGSWSGILNSPEITSNSAGTIVFTAGDPGAKLDFGTSPALVQIKIDGACNSAGYSVKRQSFGESATSSDGITNVTTTTVGSACVITFSTQYFSQFTVAKVASGSTANTSSSSSSGGGGGGGSSTPPTTTAAVEDEEFELQSAGVASPFTDIDGHWAAEFIDNLRLMGAIDGKATGIFAPDDNLTRAELVKIVVNLYGIEVPTEVTTQPFSDVKIDEWYAPFVAAVKTAGIVDGYDNNTFRPNNPVSRVEALKIILGATGFEIVGGEMNFPDTESGQWYEKYVAFAVLHELMSGYENGNFGPGNPMTRAQFAKVAMLSLDIAEPQ